MAETEVLHCLPTGLKTAFNERAWMNQYCHQFNCYAYGLNAPLTGFAHPGQLMLEKPDLSYTYEITKKRMEKWLKKDGLERLGVTEALDGNRHVIAAFASGRDFHFFRRDANGLWSHKMGYTRPSQSTWDGQRITAPHSMPGGYLHYPVFCGYYAVPENGIPYRPRIEIPDSSLCIMTSSYPK